MTNIKAIFFDIDGTLVSFNTHCVPQSTIDTLVKLREKGIKLFISSGRHIKSINNLGDLKFDGYVTINGAMTIVDNKVIQEKCIPQEDIERAIDYMNNNHPFPCTFVMKDELVINQYNEAVEQVFKQLNFPHLPQADLNIYNGQKVYQMISFFTEEDEKEIMGQMSGCSSARWSPLFTDIVPKGTSKVDGLQTICNYFGIKQEETMAFGDGGNDIEMLEWAKIGVAMGNADEKVKKAADYTTTSVDNNGIANAIEKLLSI